MYTKNGLERVESMPQGRFTALKFTILSRWANDKPTPLRRVKNNRVEGGK